MFLKSLSRSKKSVRRNRTRRLSPEPLEKRLVLAGAIDFCVPVESGQQPDVPSQNSKADFRSELGKKDSGTISKPFRLRGAGTAPDGLPLVPGAEGSFSSSGFATGLGRYTGSGDLTLGSLDISETGAVSGTFQGTFVFTAANGDQLAVTFGDDFSGKLTGQVLADGVTVGNVQFDAFFAPDPANSTGDFTRAVGGGWRMIAKADSISLASETPGYTAPFEFSWSGRGELEYAKKSTISKPFRLRGAGPAPDGLPLGPGTEGSFSSSGFATGLGRYTGSGDLTLGSLDISETGAVSGTFQGTFVFTAANGDQLAVTFGDDFSGKLTGQVLADGVTVGNVQFDAFFAPDPANSTGRFTRAVGGGWRMIAKADSISLASETPGYTAPFEFNWSGRGSLEYAR